MKLNSNPTIERQVLDSSRVLVFTSIKKMFVESSLNSARKIFQGEVLDQN